MEEQILDTQTHDISGDDGQDTTSEVAAGNDGQQNQSEKKMFAQEEVDRVVTERLNRERKKWQKEIDSRPEVQFFKKAGIDPSDALNRWEAQQTQAYVDQGVDPAIAQQMAAIQAQTLQAQQGLLDTRLDVEETRLGSQLEKDGLAQDWTEIRDDVRDFARKTGLGLEQALYAVAGPKLLQKIRSNTETATLARVKERAQRGVESAEGGGELEKLGLSAEELAFARGSGYDLKEYAALKNASDLDSYLKLKSRK